jgi:acyl carrier protein
MVVMAITTDVLMRFLEEELAVDAEEIEPDTLLFSTGVVDSFSLVSLITFVENEGGFRVSPGDVTLENFDSVERIVAFANNR